MCAAPRRTHRVYPGAVVQGGCRLVWHSVRGAGCIAVCTGAWGANMPNGPGMLSHSLGPPHFPRDVLTTVLCDIFGLVCFPLGARPSPPKGCGCSPLAAQKLRDRCVQDIGGHIVESESSSTAGMKIGEGRSRPRPDRGRAETLSVRVGDHFIE